MTNADRIEMLKEACGLVCGWCRAGLEQYPHVRSPQGSLMHRHTAQYPTNRVHCYAAKIWVRIQELEKGDAV